MNTDIKNKCFNAYISLIKDNDFNDINVVMISKCANISRRSFYNHFNNINELILFGYNNIIDNIIKRINDNLNKTINNIINYVDINRDIFLVIKNKDFILFKKLLDSKFIIDKNYLYKSGIVINVILYYLDTNKKML